VFALSACAASGVSIAGFNITLELAPARRDIPLYTALYNVVAAPFKIAAPLAGGLIADAGGLPVVMGLAALCAVAAFALTLRVVEPRKKLQSPGGPVSAM
jgi:hypothetical protein